MTSTPTPSLEVTCRHCGRPWIRRTLNPKRCPFSYLGCGKPWPLGKPDPLEVPAPDQKEVTQ